MAPGVDPIAVLISNLAISMITIVYGFMGAVTVYLIQKYHEMKIDKKVKNQKKHPKQAADIESRSLSNKPFMGATIDALGDVVLNTEQVWQKLIIQRDAGANAQRLRRGNDSVDTRILDQVANNQFQVGNKGIIDSELDVMRWDTYLKELTAYDNNAIEQPDEASYRSML